MSLPWDVTGTVGLVLLVVSFSLNALGRLGRDTVAYTSMNAAGSAILGVYSYVLNVPVFVVLEIVWCAVAVFGLVQIVRGRRAQSQTRV